MKQLCENRRCLKPLSLKRRTLGARYCDRLCAQREKARRAAQRTKLPYRCNAILATGKRCPKPTAGTRCYWHH